MSKNNSKILKSYLKQVELVEGIYIERENRFVAKVQVNSEILRCHLPNPGRMVELLFPNETIVYIRYSKSKNRKTAASIIACKVNDEIINLDTGLFRELLEFGIENNCLSLFENWTIKRFEIPIGNHRFDLVIDNKMTEVIIEVKSTTRVIDEIACFPDAVSERATLHLRKLQEIAISGKVAIIFMIYRNAKRFQPCADIDPIFANEFQNIKDKIPIYPILMKTQLDERGLKFQFDKILPIA